MPKITYIEPTGNETVVDLPVGWTLMQGATTHGIDGIEAECGGSCACATCHCYVESLADHLPAPSENEENMLANVTAERRPNCRLSCQIRPRPLSKAWSFACRQRRASRRRCRPPMSSSAAARPPSRRPSPCAARVTRATC